MSVEDAQEEKIPDHIWPQPEDPARFRHEH
jgi:hypothetical protein